MEDSFCQTHLVCSVIEWMNCMVFTHFTFFAHHITLFTCENNNNSIHYNINQSPRAAYFENYGGKRLHVKSFSAYQCWHENPMDKWAVPLQWFGQYLWHQVVRPPIFWKHWHMIYHTFCCQQHQYLCFSIQSPSIYLVDSTFIQLLIWQE